MHFPAIPIDGIIQINRIIYVPLTCPTAPLPPHA